MLRILDRYILREVAVSWLSVSGVLLAIMLTNQVARVLERAAESQYPRGVVFELIVLGALQNLALVMPDRPAARHRAGIRPPLPRQRDDGRPGLRRRRRGRCSCRCSASRPCSSRRWPCLSLQVVARSRRPHARAAREALRAGQFAPITSGKFSIFGGGSTVVYAQGAEKDGTLRRVFVERNRGITLEIALAQRATHAYPKTATCRSSRCTTASVTKASPVSAVPHRALRREPFPCACRRSPEATLTLEGVPTRTLLGVERSHATRRAPLAPGAAHHGAWSWRSSPCRSRGCARARAVTRASASPSSSSSCTSSSSSPGRCGSSAARSPEWLGLWWVHAVGRAASPRAPAACRAGSRPRGTDATWRGSPRRGRRHEPARSLHHPRRARRRAGRRGRCC